MRKRWNVDWMGIALRLLSLALVLFVFWFVFERHGLADVPLAEATIGELLLAAVLVWFGLWASGADYPRGRG